MCNLKKLRTERNISLLEFSQILDIPMGRLKIIEMNKLAVDEYTCVRITNALNINPNQLLIKKQ